MGVPFSTTITTTVPSPTSRPRLGSPTKGDGQRVRDGLTTIKMGGLTSWSPITLTGPRRTISGVENALLVIALTAIQATTGARKPNSIITITMALLLT